MNLDIQYKIKKNNNYVRYIREHSYFYKILNRNPDSFKYFEGEVKKNYKLTVGDKLEKVYEVSEMLSSIVSMLK